MKKKQAPLLRVGKTRNPPKDKYSPNGVGEIIFWDDSKMSVEISTGNGWDFKQTRHGRYLGVLRFHADITREEAALVYKSLEKALGKADSSILNIYN